MDPEELERLRQAGWSVEDGSAADADVPEGWSVEPDVTEIRSLEQGETEETLRGAGVGTAPDTDETPGGSQVAPSGRRRGRVFELAPTEIVGRAGVLKPDETPEEREVLERDPAYRAERSIVAPRGDDATGLQLSSFPAGLRWLYERPLVRRMEDTAERDGRYRTGEIAGAGMGLSQGLADELYGALAAGAAPPDQRGAAYERARDQARARYGEAREADPAGFETGDVAGTSASLALAPQGPARSSWAGRFSQAAAEGVGIGGLQGFGRSEGETPVEVARDTAGGAAAGGITGGAVQGGGEILGRMGRWLSGVANRNAPQLRNRAAGIRYAPDVNRAAAYPGGEEALAQRLRDLDISRGFRSTAAAGERASAVRADAGRRMGDIADQMDLAGEVTGEGPYRSTAPGRVDVRTLLEELGAISREHQALPSGAPIAGAADAYAERLAPHAAEGMPFSIAHRERQLLDAQIPWEQRATHPLAPLGKLRSRLRGRLSGSMDEAIEGSMGAEQRAGWRRANEDYGAASIAERGQRSLQRRGNSNRIVSLTDTIAGSAGLAGGAAAFGGVTSPGALATGLGLGLANRAIRGREHAIAATVLESIQSIARSNPAAFQRWPQIVQAAARGGDALATTHFVLITSDPDYRAQVERLEEQNETAADAAGGM